MAILIADSGATKCEWCFINGKNKKTITTQGISPYFLSKTQIVELLQQNLLPIIKANAVEKIFYYGTGIKNANNKKVIMQALKQLFANAKLEVNNDLLAAARALCGNNSGIACILGTGSNSCFYNGKKIVTNSPGLGYVLGDEGSGAYLGKKVIQYYLYKTFDEELETIFNKQFKTTPVEILENVYKKPLPNKYLATFTSFLVENRGHYMVENIIEDGLNDFFFTHLCKYKQTWQLPINFVGSVAFGFKDVLKTLCSAYEIKLGVVLKKPMDGLIKYHF